MTRLPVALSRLRCIAVIRTGCRPNKIRPSFILKEYETCILCAYPCYRPTSKSHTLVVHNSNPSATDLYHFVHLPFPPITYVRYIVFYNMPTPPDDTFYADTCVDTCSLVPVTMSFALQNVQEAAAIFAPTHPRRVGQLSAPESTASRARGELSAGLTMHDCPTTTNPAHC
jgi:hypothetical protein